MSESTFDPELPRDEESGCDPQSEDELQSEDLWELEDDLSELRGLDGASALSDEAYAKLLAVRSTSEFEIVESLSQHWERVLPGAADLEERLQRHDPSEMIPLFETYVRQLLDAYAQELVPLFSTPKSYSGRLQWVVLNMIIRHVKPAQSSLSMGMYSPDKAIERLRALSASSPTAKAELDRYLHEYTGLWEAFVFSSFERHLKKNHLTPWRFRDPKSTFVLKYAFYLRSLEVWNTFENRVRADRYVRILHWRAVADRQYAGLPPLDRRAESPRSVPSLLPGSETSTSTNVGTQDSPSGPRSAESEEPMGSRSKASGPFPLRAKWLEDVLNRLKLTPTGYETKHDSPSRKTIENILDGKESQRANARTPCPRLELCPQSNA